ncbi:M23 family metallopeptidase [Staphylococcus chromogenes]|uniref:M23 family metallopeptidase n=1 Tax=Staphylococcus chromogenes TaxID=46126 RepID=UPI0028870841|nr:M23 family metallopeptidase [Staphylococcus chromogenes]MDT0700363.1 M23 family metallopeptidase [Staphylococcus chromogenes]
MNTDKLTDLINKCKSKHLYKLFNEELKNFITYKEFKKMFKNYHKLSGTNKLYEDLRYENEGEIIWMDINQEFGIKISIHDSLISSIYMIPINKEDQISTSKNEYIMPIDDKFYVYWGGDNELLNYHHAYTNQKYAYDLVVVNKGLTYTKDSSKVENYFCYESNVLAPCSGEVIKVENTINDNEIGDKNEYQFLGNYIVLKHANEEYSLIAHLKKDSIKVAIGDKVNSGELIAQVGNSGNSTEPHIHFQLMDNSDLMNAKSLKIRFYNGVEYKKGDYVFPAI